MNSSGLSLLHVNPAPSSAPLYFGPIGAAAAPAAPVHTLQGTFTAPAALSRIPKNLPTMTAVTTTSLRLPKAATPAASGTPLYFGGPAFDGTYATPLGGATSEALPPDGGSAPVGGELVPVTSTLNVKWIVAGLAVTGVVAAGVAVVLASSSKKRKRR